MYKAWDSHLETHVALKIPHVEGISDERRTHILARFHREAKAAARLPPHSNICPIRDHGEMEGQPYVTLAFLDGRPLSKVRKPQPIPTALRTVRRIARAMQVAHDHAVIHRDLKPDNIMIVDGDQPVVMDFGLARRLDSEESLQTADGTVMGTPAYMSPEQAGGKQAEIGPQCDVYSLGVICYELLTGRRPFDADSILALLTKIATGTPAPPSRLNPEIDAALDEICLRAIARDRDIRYASMREMDEALADYSNAVRGRKRRATSKLQRESVLTQPLPTTELTPAELFPEREEQTESDVAIELLQFVPILTDEHLDPPTHTQASLSTSGTETIAIKLDPTDRKAIRPRPRKSPWRDPKLMMIAAGSAFVLLLAGIVFLFQTKQGAIRVEIEPDPPKSNPLPPEEAEFLSPIEKAREARELKVERLLHNVQAEFLGQKAGETRSDNGLKMILAWCPPGNFTMGSPQSEKDRGADEDQVQVTLTNGFWLGQTEVTQGQWEAVMGTTPWKGQDYVKEGGNYPATNLSWEDATAFSKKLTEQERKAGRLPEGGEYVLPTEAQWEYACRAGSTTAYSFGDDVAKLGEYAWFNKNAWNVDEQFAHLVGTKKPNSWGLSDMHGNVWEWCQDMYADKLPGGRDPLVAAGASFRVRRGGCGDYAARPCRSALRFRSAPDDRYRHLGFRVAAVIPGINQPDNVMSVSDPGVRDSNSVPKPKKPARPELLVAPFNSETARESQEAWAKFLGHQDFVETNSLGMKMVLIPPGEFQMGSTPEQIEQIVKFDPSFKKEWGDNEQPQHRVRITQPFLLGQHEVTVGQFAAFVKDMGYKTEAETDGKGGYGCNEATGKFDGPDPNYNWKNTGFPQEDSHPVVNVTHNDAQKFCEWLSQKEGVTYGLPTEAEWEYACRAGTTSIYYSGDDPEGLAAVGNVADGTFKTKFSAGDTIASEDGFVFAAPVGHFRANAFHLYDMHGNVWEWCADWYLSDYYGQSPVDDPTGPTGASPRVFRGGGWRLTAWYCRSANRLRHTPDDRSSILGFRVAAVIPGINQPDNPISVSDPGVRDSNSVPKPKKPARPELLVAPFNSDTARERQETWAKFLGHQDFVETNSLGMKMVLIPPGEFQMGSTPAQIDQVLKFDSSFKKETADDEQPRHRVRITQPFYLGQYEVTLGQFAAFVKDNGYKTEAETDGEGGYGWNDVTEKLEGRDPKYNWKNTGFSQTDSHPVVNVTWNDAVKFCEWLSRKEGVTYRLPTEAEWEYACRAGSMTLYQHGDDPENLRGWGTSAMELERKSLRTTKTLDSFPREMVLHSRPPWDNTVRMRIICTTCTATCGSGAGTGMIPAITISRRWMIRKGRCQARAGWTGAAVGSAPPGIAGRRAVSGARLATGSTTWAFGWSQ